MIAILGAALFEYCLAHGIETIICVTDAFLIPTMQSLHWRPRPLGLPSRYPEGTAVGVAIEISEDTLDQLRATHGIDGPVLDEPLEPALLAASLPAQMH
jgi:N-acyl-L-homoserine lactone synthetase